MNKIIKPEDFPLEMNEKNIDILAKMSLELPPMVEYNIILPYLSFEDKILVYERASIIQQETEKKRWHSLTPEEQEEEKRKIEASLKEGPEVFRGNILQQEWDSIALARLAQEKKDKED